MSRALPSRTLTGYFYEASFVDGNIGMSLEQSIRQALTRLSLVGERVENGKDMFCKQTLNDHNDYGAAGVGLSIIEYEPDGAAQFVPDFAKNTQVSCDAFQLGHSVQASDAWNKLHGVM